VTSTLEDGTQFTARLPLRVQTLHPPLDVVPQPAAMRSPELRQSASMTAS